MAERSRSRLEKYARLGMTVLVVGAVGMFFSITLAENWSEVADANLVPDGWWAVSLVAFAAAVPVSGLLWRAIVAKMAPTHPPTRREAVAVHVTSWLLKYIPGQVGAVINKVMWGSRRGYPRTLILVSFLYENVFMQVASIVPSVLVIALYLGGDVFAENPGTLLIPLLLVSPLLLVLVPRVLHFVLDKVALRTLKSSIPRDYVLPGVWSVTLVPAYVLPRIINSIGFVALAATIVPLEPSAWLLYAAAYTLAGALGVLAIFVPSGIGVREAVLFAVLVAGGAAPADAVILALVARFVATLADAFLGLGWTSTRLLSRKDTNRD